MTSDSIKKVPFLAWIKWNAERRRSICDCFCPAFLNTVLLNWFFQDLTQIYGQIVNFHQCVRKRQIFCQMQRLINQRAKLLGKFTAKLFLVISIMEGDCHAYAKNRIELQLIANHPGFCLCMTTFCYDVTDKKEFIQQGGCHLRANLKNRCFARTSVLAHWLSERCEALHFAKRVSCIKTKKMPDKTCRKSTVFVRHSI